MALPPPSPPVWTHPLHLPPDLDSLWNTVAPQVFLASPIWWWDCLRRWRRVLLVQQWHGVRLIWHHPLTLNYSLPSTQLSPLLPAPHGPSPTESCAQYPSYFSCAPGYHLPASVGPCVMSSPSPPPVSSGATLPCCC